MIFSTGDIIAVVIALVGACVVIVMSINAHGHLYRENNRLREELKRLRKQNLELKAKG